MKMENGTKSDETLLKYGRDYLLQLRMHPMSLHKPDLPECEIVKNRLYLHQVDNMASDIPLNPYSDNFRTLIRPENIAKFFQQYSYSGGYTPRNCSFYAASCQKGNSAIPLSKYHHSSFNHNYLNSVQKNTYRPSPAYKTDITTDDFFENITDVQNVPWLKEAFSMCAPESGMWNVNQNIMPSNTRPPSKRENTNLKTKKKLSIIDPKTGKDILDEIGDTSTTPSQSSLSSKENTEDEMKNIQPENTVLNTEVPDNQEKNVHANGQCITSDEEYQQTSVSETQSKDDALLSLSQEYESFLDQFSSFKSPSKKTEIQGNHEVYETNEKTVYENMMKSEGHAVNVNMYSNSNMDFGADNIENEEFDKSCQNVTEMLQSYNATSVPDRGKSNLYTRQGNNEGDLRERIGTLRDKIYAMRQEQQKMFILQSFLRFKKHQLDESFRSLDDKKIDMVNWEYNLYNKARKLLEKEQWIETKTMDLKRKEKELEEKEKWLNLKVSDMERHNCDMLKKNVKNGSKENVNGVPKESGKGDALSENKTEGKMASGKEDHQKYHKHPKMVENCDTTYAQSVDFSSGDVCATTSIKESHVSKPLLDKESASTETPCVTKELNAQKKTITAEKESEKYDSLKAAIKNKKSSQHYLNDSVTSQVSEIQNTSVKQQKYKFGKFDDSSSSYNRKYSECRKYYPEHIRY